jgi:carbonic anhydrase
MDARSPEAFGDLDEDVRQSIARIKASPFIPNPEAVRGFVFDVATGSWPRPASKPKQSQPNGCG